MSQENPNQYFMALLQQHEFIGMIGLGKVADPATNKAETDLEKAKYAIGILEMMEKKTAGNLNEIELQALQRVLTSLRINFVDEMKKSPNQSPAQEPEESAEDQTDS